jgi:hypothetical protein
MEGLPEVHTSLRMINTLNAIPQQPSLGDLDLPPPPSAEEDSLAERISPLPTAPNSTKKRKLGCTCKKTFCLKMYCECFSQGKQCGEDCACLSCKNAPGFEELIQSAKQGVKEGGSRSCRLAEKRCNCKKSHCLKRYCECYNAGIGCGPGCRCEGCENKGPSEKEESDEEEAPQELPVQFPSIGGVRSVEDLERFYN